MEIFLDGGNIEEIKEFRELGLISGVTTNPRICGVEAVSRNPVDLIRKIVEAMGDGYVFVQVISRDPHTQLEEAKFLSDLGPRIVVKVLMDKVGFKSIPLMVKAGIQVSATAVNTIGRAILAAECGAHYVIPYYFWLQETMEGPTNLVADMAEIYKAQNYASKMHIYCGRVEDIAIAAKSGAWGVLLNAPYLEHFFHHAQTEIALKEHRDAWEPQYGKTTWLDYATA